MSLAIFTLETVIIGGLPVVKLVNIWNSETFVQYIEESQEDTTVDIDSEETLIIDEIWAALNTKLNYTHKGYYTFNDLQIADQAITTTAFIVHIQQRCAFHSILDGSTIYGPVSLVTDRPENGTLAFIYENGVLYARTANGRYFYDTVWLKYATNQDIVSLQAEIDSDISTHNLSGTAHDDIRTSVIPLTYIDTDVALTANSDIKIASQKATKTYSDTKVSTHNLSETAHGKGSANGIAELDANGHVPSSQLPSYVDDVLEYANFATLPAEGEAAKIYITLDDNKTYRWGGTVYVFMSDDVTLGETNATAYRGDRGKTAYDHSQVIDGTNPHATTFANIASKPTTLAGIGITDAFTKAETTALLEVLKTTYGLTEQLIATLADTNTLAMANVSAYDFLLLELQNISGAHEVFGSVVIKPETFTAAGDLVQIETKEGATILSYATLTYDGSTNFTFGSSNAADTLVVTGYKKDEVVAIGVITTHADNTLTNAGLTVKADIDETVARVDANTVDIAYLQSNVGVTEYGVREIVNQSSPTLERVKKIGATIFIGAATGLVAAAGIDDGTVTNSFDAIPIFARQRVTGADGNTFVKVNKYYIKEEWVSYDGTNYHYLWMCQTKLSGYRTPLSFTNEDGSENDCYFIGAYEASLFGSTLKSVSGAVPKVSYSRANFRTAARLNDGLGTASKYQIDDPAEWTDLVQIPLMIEFATKNMQSVMVGFTTGSYTATHLPLVAEAAVNRVILTNAQAALYRVGQMIDIGTSQGGRQVAQDRQIVSITVDTPEAGQSEIIFDGAAITTTLTQMVYNVAYKTGQCDAVVASSGSKTANDGKYSCIWRGMENPYGNTFKNVDGVKISNNQTWICLFPSLYNDTASVAGDYESPFVKLSYVNINANGYCVELGYDTLYPFAKFPTSITGGSSVLFFSDYYYQNTGDRTVFVGGACYNSSSAGPFFWGLSNGLGYADLHFGARLSKRP
jgi:hypothetical protein